MAFRGLVETMRSETRGLPLSETVDHVIAKSGLVEHYLAHYYYDFLHPVWYATLLALLLGRAFDRNGVTAASA